MNYANLEIALHRGTATSYVVDLRCSLPGDEAEIRLSPNDRCLAEFDLYALGTLVNDSAAYGQALSASLFAEPALREAFIKVRTTAAALNVALRLRLYIGSSAPELHALHWETLRNPEDNSALLLGEQLLFSRYLSGDDWRPIYLRPKGTLRALVVVANPTDLAKYNLAPIDTNAEINRACASLKKITVTTLASSGTATLDGIAAQLRDGYDILYLVCHGTLRRSEPWLWLEASNGVTAHVAGEDLAQRVSELRERPRLVVLASCQSAGEGNGPAANDTAALAGLGPRLIAAGVPAVIAMQGRILMDTVAGFMPIFFRELERHGQIDQAMAVARTAVRSQSDHWMPVLFMCLYNGLLWETDGIIRSTPKPFEPEMVLIPAGTFLMGSDGHEQQEQPQHTVFLPAYHISKYPITCREYTEFLKRNPKVTQPQGWYLREPPAGKENHPVTSVSWHDAVAYCNWLSAETKLPYRLPSEAEWEKGARGTRGYRYPWGDTWKDGCCNHNGYDTTPVQVHHVGASPYGCLDMIGNVQEWTSTLWGNDRERNYFPYPYRSEDGREEVKPGFYPILHIHRGGGFKDRPQQVSVSTRGIASIDSRVSWRGFRVAVSYL